MGKTTWGIQLEDEFIDIQKLTDGDMALINEIKNDIMKIENIKCQDRALLCAFAAYLYLKSMAENVKMHSSDRLH